jgi:hypothetical protein
LLFTAAFGGPAIWFADWPFLTGTLVLGIALMLAWFAAAFAWAGTTR